MRSAFRNLVRLSGATAVIIGMYGAVVEADVRRERFGAMDLALESTRWRIETGAANTLTIVPVGKLAEERRPVVMSQTPAQDLKACETMARQHLPASLYGDAMAGDMEIAGLKAKVVRASTRCRNATPAGAVICIPHRGVGYLLIDRIAGCRSAGGNPFAGNVGLDEIVGGVAFDPQ